jgi:hypothetical protein
MNRSQGLFDDQQRVVADERVGLVAQDAMCKNCPQAVECATGSGGHINREFDRGDDLLLVVGSICRLHVSEAGRCEAERAVVGALELVQRLDPHRHSISCAPTPCYCLSLADPARAAVVSGLDCSSQVIPRIARTATCRSTVSRSTVVSMRSCVAAGGSYRVSGGV